MKEPAEPGLQLALPGSSPSENEQVVSLPGQAARPLPGADRKKPETRKKPIIPEDKKTPGLWYALYLPDFLHLPDTLGQQRLEQLARLATQVSSSVSLHPCALILEIRSSLRYFAGIDNLHETLAARVLQQLQEWQLPEQFNYAASPSVTGSLLLARGGCNLLVQRPESLRSALGRLSTDVLELDREQRRRLYSMGVRRLQDLWRLPAGGLRKRFGSQFVNQLHQALGQRPEPQQYYQPPPAFSTSYDLPCEVENTALLLPVLEEFLAQLVDFLRRRDLSTSRLIISLAHERQSSTDIVLGLRQPSRCQQHLQQLLEIQLHNLAIPAPVVAVKMQVKRFDAYLGTSGRLLPEETPDDTECGTPGSGTSGRYVRYRDERFDLFMDQLQARVGGQHIRKIGSVAEHCPEYASRQLDSLHTPDRNDYRGQPVNPRPFWLLPEPRLLTVTGGRLYHHRPIHILSGPERIESRWWSGSDIRRDYYVAREENGSRLWIFREKTGQRCWYLHGIFA